MTENKQNKSGEIPNELFDRGDLTKRIYKFMGLDGKEQEIYLKPGEFLIPRRCSLDGAYIVAHNGDIHMIPRCPSCNLNFGDDGPMNYLKEHFIPRLKREISKLEQELIESKLLLNAAENPDNEIKKANLMNKPYLSE